MTKGIAGPRVDHACNLEHPRGLDAECVSRNLVEHNGYRYKRGACSEPNDLLHARHKGAECANARPRFVHTIGPMGYYDEALRLITKRV